MFNTLRGKILETSDQKITLELPSLGISFTLFTPQSESFIKLQETSVFVHMHWNQEQGPSLFAFATAAQRDTFIVLLGCSGIGPKVALALLGSLQPHELVHAVTSGDHETISRVKGIGTKKAEQLMLYLKNKLEHIQDIPEVGSNSLLPASTLTQVSQVLASLNYSRAEVQRAIGHLKTQSYDGSPEFAVLVRAALSFLSNRAIN